MNIHVCKQCGSQFIYCRACVFKPIRYKDAGFCSKECYEASKGTMSFFVQQDVVEEDIAIEESQCVSDTIESVKQVDEEVLVETVVDVIGDIDNDVVEIIAAAEPIIKKKTNAYKKKKRQH